MVRILAVHDRPESLVSLQSALLEWLPDCEILTAGAANEALRVLAEQSVEVVIVGLRTPGAPGIELVRRVRSDPSIPDKPVLILASHEATPQQRIEALQAGADECVTTPMDEAELAARIRVLLRNRQAEDILRDLNARQAQIIEVRTAELEESRRRLDQAQRLEALGRLAGGIAHDFNNALTAIMGNAQLLAMQLQHQEELASLAEQILTASRRAGDLTRQLLAFARKGRNRLVAVDLHKAIDETIKLLSRTTDRKVEIARRFDADRATIEGDPSQVQNALLNLAINACDAMPAGGTLEFATRTVPSEIAQAARIPPSSADGAWLEVSIRDTGHGMDEHVLTHMFEPFFTTKDVGNGTGLGLPNVCGFIARHAGGIDVRSRPDIGTTFALYLPLAQTALDDEERPATDRVTGSGHVVVVDDEEMVRRYARRALEALGYHVTDFDNAQDAVVFIAKTAEPLDLVILDMIMPRMDGPEALACIRRSNPTLPVMFSSGYSDADPTEAAVASGANGFLLKPYRVEELSSKIDNVLRASRGEQVQA